MTAWVLILLVFAVLWVFWKLMNWSFDLIERRWDEAMSPIREKESSES